MLRAFPSIHAAGAAFALASLLSGTVFAQSPLELGPGSGLFNAPVEVSVQTQGRSLYFSTNGSVPSVDLKSAWTGRLTVAHTTTLRVAAVKDGQIEHAQTATYIFPRQVAQQTGAGFPAAWGTTNGQAVIGSYGMAPE